MPEYWSAYQGGPYSPALEVDTGLDADTVGSIAARLTTYPESFHIHPKIRKLLEQRAGMGQNAADEHGMVR